MADLSGTEWMDLGLCAETDPEAFFPEKGGSVLPAKRTCGRCFVKQQCLEYALEHWHDGVNGAMGTGRWGVWGGTSPEERQHMIAARKETAA